jgi:hypothetical protein
MSHDAAVLRLRDKVSEYHEVIRSSAELKEVYDGATQPEMIRKMVEAYPHAFPSAQDDEQVLQSTLGPDEERLATLSEAIVNERGEVILGSGWGPAPFWNLHREVLIGVSRGGRFSDYLREVAQAWTELASIIESATDCLKGVRHQLAIRHGEPYVLETASFGAPPAVSGFLRLH